MDISVPCSARTAVILGAPTCQNLMTTAAGLHSTVDGHFIPIATSFIEIDPKEPKCEREYFSIGINWRCQFVIPEYPIGALGSVLALLAALGLYLTFPAKRVLLLKK